MFLKEHKGSGFGYFLQLFSFFSQQSEMTHDNLGQLLQHKGLGAGGPSQSFSLSFYPAMFR